LGYRVWGSRGGVLDFGFRVDDRAALALAHLVSGWERLISTHSRETAFYLPSVPPDNWVEGSGLRVLDVVGGVLEFRVSFFEVTVPEGPKKCNPTIGQPKGFILPCQPGSGFQVSGQGVEDYGLGIMPA
jgi:hypothetical protein